MDNDCTRFGFRCCSMPIDPVMELPEDPLKLETVYTTEHHVWSDTNRPIIPLCHHGQRKLLFAELHFFRKCCEIQGNCSTTKLAGKVIYAGAASGIHIPILAEMFPKLQWILFDPNPFDISVLSHPRCVCIRTKFDVQSAMKATGTSKEPIWFISDIRSTNSDKDVVEDMKLQSAWVRELKPKLASLKFRLPFLDLGSLRSNKVSNITNDRLVEYMDGDLYGQVNAPAYSSEARLYTDATRLDVTYSVLKYESRMQGYNYFTRNARYVVPFVHRNVVMCVPGYDNGFESMVELSLLPENDIQYVVNFEKLMLKATKRHLSTCAVSHQRDKSSISYGFASKCALQSLSRKYDRIRNIILDTGTRDWLLNEIDLCKRVLSDGKENEQDGGNTRGKTNRRLYSYTRDKNIQNNILHIENPDSKGEEEDDTLERLLRIYEELNSLYKRNSVRIEDYGERLKDMHLTTNTTISTKTGITRETQYGYTSKPKTSLHIPQSVFLPPDKAPALTNDSRVLMISHNMRMAQRILYDHDYKIDIVGISGKWYRNMIDISTFLKRNNASTFQWGGLIVDSWLLNNVMNVDKYDYVMIDIGGDIDCTETVTALDSMASKFKKDVCINVFCWHPRTQSALSAMRSFSERYTVCTVSSNWYSPIIINHFQTLNQVSQIFGAHMFWGGRNGDTYDFRPDRKNVGYKFDDAILIELNNRKEAIEKAYWYFLTQETTEISNKGGSTESVYSSHFAAFGVLTIVSVMSLLRPIAA